MISSGEYYQKIRQNNANYITSRKGDNWAYLQMPHLKDQDAVFVADQDEVTVAGVLDGLGSYPESGEVSRDIAEYIEICINDGSIDAKQFASDPEAYYAYFFDLVDFASGRNGSTTLTMAAVDRSARKLGYASIGDSRIYLLNRVSYGNQPEPFDSFMCREHEATQPVRQLSTDEQKRGYLSNTLSTENFKGPRQLRSIPIDPGDRIVLMTDGVYRDGSSLHGSFSARQIGEFVDPSLSPLDAVTRLVMQEAFWPDDRTAVVIDA